MHRRASLLVWLAGGWLAAAACGSRTPLLPEGPPEHQPLTTVDAGSDADAGQDAGFDAGIDSPDIADVPRAECSLTPPATTWMKPVYGGGGSREVAEVFATTVDADGTFFAAGCGQFEGCADYSLGTGACFILKATPDGHLLFVHRFDDGINDPLTIGLSPDGQGGVVLGLEDDEGTNLGSAQPFGCVVERLDGYGNVVFVRPLPGADCRSSYPTFAFGGDRNGRSVIVAGCPPGADICDSQDGAKVLYLDADGSTIAEKTLLGEAPSMYLSAATIQSDGSVFIGGYSRSAIDFGAGPVGNGETIAMAAFDAHLGLRKTIVVDDVSTEMQVLSTPDGAGFIVAGTIDRDGIDFGGGALAYTGDSIRGGPNKDLFLARFTVGLDHVWSHSYGDTSDQNTTALCTDPDGTVSWLGRVGYEAIFDGQVVSGDPTTPDDGFLIRMSAQGKTVGVGTVPADGTNGADQIGCALGSYVLVGHVGESVNFGAGDVPTGAGFIVKRPKPMP